MPRQKHRRARAIARSRVPQPPAQLPPLEAKRRPQARTDARGKVRRGQSTLRFASVGAEKSFRKALRKRLAKLRPLLAKAASREFARLQESRDDSTRTDADEAEALAKEWRGTWARIGDDPTDAADGIAASVDRSVTSTVKGAIDAANIDRRYIPADMDLSETASTIAGRIKSLEDFYIGKVASHLERIGKSESSQQDLRDMLIHQAGLADRKAELLARDVVGTLTAEIATARAKEAGVPGYIWRTMRDERVRPEHEEREGEKFTWDDPPEDGHPGEPPLCLPGDAVLDDAQFAEVLYRRWYNGELTTLVTHTGKTLRATPNHPVLTARGWVPIAEVQVGDHIVEACRQALDGAEANVYSRKATLGESFEALAPLVGHVRLPGTRGQFHGDGLVDHKVDIVDINSHLPRELDAALAEGFGELLLAWADRAAPDAALASLGMLPLTLGSLFRAPPSVLRGACKLLALVCGHLGMAREHRIASAARLDALAEQAPPNDRARYAEFFGERFLAHSVGVGTSDVFARQVLTVVRLVALSGIGAQPARAEVLGQRVCADANLAGNMLEGVPGFEQFGRVAEKRIGYFAGHVYNLQTCTGWYTACGAVVKNCRCYAEPDLDSVFDVLDGED